MMTREKILLLFSMWISNVGEWVYFIGLNMIVLRLTDSPFAVSVLYMITPIAAIMTNSWAGTFIDRMDTKKLLVALNVARAAFILVLAATTSTAFIYGLSFILQVMNTIFSTASFVYMTKLIGVSEQQRFNAWRNFVQSSGFILGPSIAGLLFLIGAPQLAIIVNGIALLLSALIIWRLPDIEKAVPAHEKVTLQLIREDWRRVSNHSRKERFVSILYVFSSSIIVCMTALDSLEAAFAQKDLGLAEATYGLLVSVAGLGLIAGSLINAKWPYSPLFSMKYGAIFIAFGYLIYAVSHQFATAAIGCFILTFAHCYVNIGFITYIQRNIPTALLGRFTSVFGLFESLGTLSLVLVFGVAAEQMGLRPVILTGSFLLLGIALWQAVLVQRKQSGAI